MSGCRRTRILVGIVAATLVAAGRGLAADHYRKEHRGVPRSLRGGTSGQDDCREGKVILAFPNVLKAGFWAGSLRRGRAFVD
jgi:hypothetical protein